MVGKDAPTLFSKDSEADGRGFICVEPSDWSWGTSNSDNGSTPALVLTTGNCGSTGAWATNPGVPEVALRE